MSLEPLLRHFRDKTVPDHRYTRWYIFGGLTLFFFGVQAVSGLLLTLYYQPSPESAYESVSRIMGEASFGWFVRAVHVWSSHLLIISALVHVTAKFYFRSYRHPRSATWISGVALILILFGFAFTGHLLPWDVTGYYATQIGTDIAAAVPVIGALLAGFLRGGSEYVDGMTLTRVYSIHTVVLPFLACLIVVFHLLQNLLRESASPDGVSIRGQIPLYPDFLYRNAFAWLLGAMLLFTVSIFFPAFSGPKVDILAAPPPGIRPEWYFLPLFQALRLLPGTIGGLDTEVAVNLAVIVLVAALFAMPWLDRGNGRLLRLVGAVFIVYNFAAIILAYITI
jgi:quinol-cytochrome oxidoreductase complex cytochrome b subunit